MSDINTTADVNPREADIARFSPRFPYDIPPETLLRRREVAAALNAAGFPIINPSISKFVFCIDGVRRE